MSSDSAPALEEPQRRRRSRHRIFWHIINPPARRLAGFAPWWVSNIESTPEVRIKLAGRWHHAHATVHRYDEATVRRFNLYARSGPRTLGIDPALVRVELHR